MSNKGTRPRICTILPLNHTFKGNLSLLLQPNQTISTPLTITFLPESLLAVGCYRLILGLFIHSKLVIIRQTLLYVEYAPVNFIITLSPFILLTVLSWLGICWLWNPHRFPSFRSTQNN